MAVILSRKGFDSNAGRMYLPFDSKTGEYAFLHRPETKLTVDGKYKGVDYNLLPTNFLNFNTIGEILNSKNKLPSFGAHLDPDLVKVLPINNWKPAFGQKGSAQGYLQKRGVGEASVGSLFLFFSRFKPWKKNDVGLTEGYYIYGWLEVGETILPSKLDNALDYHPHFSKKYREKTNNIIYVASKNISGTNIPGAGMFKFLSNTLRLSYHKNKDLLKWKLPKSLFNGFSRLKSYDVINDSYCTAEWPATFCQEAVCSNTIIKNKKLMSNVRRWSINLIRKGFENNGIKHNFL